MAGGNPEGYVLMLQGGTHADPLYCSLVEGTLEFRPSKDADVTQRVQLSGYKVIVKYIENCPDEVPYRIRIRCVPKKARTVAEPKSIFGLFSRMMRETPQSVTLTIATSTEDLQQKWAIAILNWHKRCWDDPIELFDSKNERESLLLLMRQYGRQPTASRAQVASVTPI